MKSRGHTEQTLRMLHTQGRLLGTTGDVTYYVLDGQVWVHRPGPEAEKIGDYFEFCEQVRQNQFPEYQWAKRITA